MARPVSHDEALRDRLLIATAELVDRKGAERVSLREAAMAAETSTSAVYALFGSKPHLLVAVVEHALRSFGLAQAAAEPHGLRALGVAYRAWAQANPAMYRLMFSGEIDGESCGPDEQVATAAIMPLVRTMAARSRQDDPLQNAVVVWAQVHGAVSLEMTAMAPTQVDWEAVYETVLDAVERAFPAHPDAAHPDGEV